MIPLRALLYRRGTPIVTILLICINSLCFLYELSFPVWLRDRFIYQFALVPDHLHLSSFVTSMFLHSGWLHLIGNMWFLWVFGSHLEDAIGPAKFAAFYFVAGIASAAVEVMFTLGDPHPVIGASGAIAGVMGGFLILYPRVRVLTLIFVFFFVTTVELPAAFMLVYWFAIQLLSGFASIASVSQASGVAWFAHVGGFLAGLLLVKAFYTAPRRFLY